MSQVKTEKLPGVAGYVPNMKEAEPASAKDQKGKVNKKGEAKKAPTAKISAEVSYNNLFKDHVVGGADTTGRDLMRGRASGSGDIATAQQVGIKAEAPETKALAGVYSGGNLNIRDNMQAAAGVLFREGENYVDRGPSYLEQRKGSAAESMRTKP